jgi:hypothetical protein
MRNVRNAFLSALMASAGVVALVSAGTAVAQSPGGQQPWTQGQQFGSMSPGPQAFSGGPGSPGTGMPMHQGVPSEQQVRSFFQQVEQTVNAAARSGNRAQAFNFIRAHLAQDAEFWSTAELYIGGRHVASTLVNVNDDTLSSMLGYAASAMHGRDNVQNYQLSINIRHMEPTRRGTVRVSTTMSESGQLMHGGTASGPMAQYQGSGHMGSQAQQDWQRQAYSGQGQGYGQGGGGGGYAGTSSPTFTAGQQSFGGSAVINFNTQATCTHELSLGNQGQVEIGNSRCRSRVDIVG